MNKKDIKSIVYLLKQAKENNKPKPIIFLGAGASISAGIPGANRIKDDILKRFKDKPEIINLPAKQKTYYELMKCLNTTERHELLRGYITSKNVKINVTHIYLANLLAQEYVDYILTVNFDDLLLRACALFNFLPPVYDISVLKDFTTTTLQEKSVTYLHGQHNGFWLLNTEEELDKVRSSVPKILNRICHGRTWIVIGYSGEDPIFEHIANLGRFDNDLFWVGYKENEPIKQVKDNLLKKPNVNAYWVTGYDADSFFLKLHSELKLDTPEIFNKPFSFLKSMVSNIIDIKEEKDTNTENPNPYQEVNERLRLTKQNIDKAIQSFEKATPLKTVNLQSQVYINNLKQKIIEKTVKEDYSNLEEIENKVRKINKTHLSKLLAVLYFNWGTTIYHLAALKGKEELYIQSLEKFKKAVEFNSRQENAFNNWGITLFDLAKLKKDETLFEESIEKFKIVTEINLNHAFAFLNWGNAIVELARLKGDENLIIESFEKYKKVTELNPENAAAFNNWGNAIVELARLNRDESLFIESFEKYKKATELDPNNAVLFNNWGQVIVELARLKGDENLIIESFEKYKKATELNPDDASAFYNWGNAIADLARFNRDESLFIESFEKYKKATELNPDDVSAFYNWGNVIADLARLKRDESLFIESFEKYKKATELNPEYAAAFNNWGTAMNSLAKLKRDESLLFESLEKFKKATELNPNNAATFNNWVASLIRYSKLFSYVSVLKYLLEAKKIAEKSVSLGEDKYNLSCIYALLKEKEKALKLLDECLKNGKIKKVQVLKDKSWKAYWEDTDFKAIIAKY